MPRFSIAQIALLAIAPTFIVASPLKLRQTDSSVSCPDSDGKTVPVGSSSFSITCDYDFYGNDLGLQWTTDIEACIAICDSTTGCVAVSYRGGACYPKSSLDGGEVTTGVWAAKKGVKLTTCPDDDGKTYTAVDGSVFTVECSVDRYGNDLATTWESTLEACIEACDTMSGCIDVSYVSGTPGPCYLKGTAGAAQANGNVWGAVNKAALPSSTSSTAASTSASSALSSAISIATPASTPGVCTAGFTTSPVSCPEPDGTCYIDSTGSVYLIECYTDRYGGDLAISWESSLESCISTCSATAGCVDVSYVPGAPGPCYMKSEANDAQSNTGVMGAKLVPILSSSTTSSAAPTTTSTDSSTSSAALTTTSTSSSTSSAVSTTTSTSTYSSTSSSTPLPTCAPGSINDADMESYGGAYSVTVVSTCQGCEYGYFDFTDVRYYPRASLTAVDGNKVGLVNMNTVGDIVTFGQSIQSLTPGGSYTVTFWNQRDSSAATVVSVDGATLLTLAQSSSNSQMSQYSISFVAGSTSAYLAFKSKCPPSVASCWTAFDALHIVPTGGACTLVG